MCKSAVRERESKREESQEETPGRSHQATRRYNNGMGNGGFAGSRLARARAPVLQVLRSRSRRTTCPALPWRLVLPPQQN